VCGICGIVRFDGRPVEYTLVKAMTERLRHRGPDDSGLWFSENGSVHVGFGSCRLSIIDLSPRGHMPMSNQNRTLWITYNGEVYNFKEIRRELKALGYSFRSDTDTEVILHAYEEWGPDCVHRFNGMFAFAIWDKRDQSLFLARDRLGVKPLYYAIQNGSFVFASEIKALLENPELPRDIDWDALNLYFTLRIIPHPYTIFKAIRKLAPGHYLIFKDGRLTEHEYWDVFGRHIGETDNESQAFSVALRNGDLSFVKRELFSLVEDAVRLRLVSDVPLGVLLSGGIDSSIVASLMVRLCDSKIKTFTLGFFDAKGVSSYYDESKTARRTAEYLGSEHHELLVTPEVVRESIPGVLNHCDEPFATSSAIPTYLISKLAREKVTVALSGDGPDEIFAGYHAYLLEPLSDIYMCIPKVLRRTFIESVVLSLPSSDTTFVKRSIRRAQRFLRSLDEVPAKRFLRLTNKFNDVSSKAVYDSKFRILSLDLAEQIFKGYYEEPALAQDRINQMLYVDTKIKLVDHILAKVDLMSMKASLEVRTPFLDYRIVEFAFRLPGSMKLNWFRKKYLLRETFRHVLPPHLFKLPKRGFEIPISEWLKRELREMFLDTVAPPAGGGILNDELIQRLYQEHCQNKSDHSQKLWIFFVLRWWARENQIKI